MNDIQKAINTKKIKKQSININDLSEIANVVMFGGNGNESKKNKNISMRIIREISKNEKVPISLKEIKSEINKNEMEDRSVKKDKTSVKTQSIKI